MWSEFARTLEGEIDVYHIHASQTLTGYTAWAPTQLASPYKKIDYDYWIKKCNNARGFTKRRLACKMRKMHLLFNVLNSWGLNVLLYNPSALAKTFYVFAIEVSFSRLFSILVSWWTKRLSKSKSFALCNNTLFLMKNWFRLRCAYGRPRIDRLKATVTPARGMHL